MQTYRHLTPRAIAELRTRASLVQDEPEKLRKAQDLVEHGCVERTGQDTWDVVGSQGTIYTMIGGKCSCKARPKPGMTWACYHALGVALYGWVEHALQEEHHPMFIEEGEASAVRMSLETPQNAPQSPIMSVAGGEDRAAGDALVEAFTGQHDEGSLSAQRATVSEDIGLRRYTHFLETEIEKRDGWYERLIERMGGIEEELVRRMEGAQTATMPLTLPKRSISAIIADLARPLPDACLGIKPKGGQKIRFLHWPTVVHLLDTYAPGWQGSVVRVDKIGERCAVTYRITIPALEGLFSHEDAGMEDEDQDEYGDAMTNAIAAALKRTAAKFGVGRWLYEKEDITRAVSGHLRAEKEAVLAEMGKLVDDHGLDRDAVITWLKVQTGAQKTAQIPLWALRALVTHLSTGTPV